MLQAALNLATLMGGLAVLGYFIDKLQARQAGEPVIGATLPPKSWWSGFGPALRRAQVETPVLLSLQWVLAVTMLTNEGLYAGFLAFLSPLWLIPLSLGVSFFITDRPWVARLVGGLAGGLITAGIEYLIRDWLANIGLVSGGYFGSLLSGFIAAKQREASLLFAILSTGLLVASLISLTDLDVLIRPFGASFVFGGVSALEAILIAVVWRVMRQKRPARTRRQRKSMP